VKAKLLLVALSIFCVAVLPSVAQAQDVQKGDVEITSGGKAYKSYLAAPAEEGTHPAIVLIHSFNGLEDGYRTMTDSLAEEGFVVLAVGWQTFTKEVDDATLMQLIDDSVTFLGTRADVDTARLGLTGFCAGGRYTMLLLPQMEAFKAGVAWYGFPNRGEPAPKDLIGDLKSPMLIIHGTNDNPSPIADIYSYATALKDANKYFELKVYANEPHGFMLDQGQLRTDEVAQDAFNEMADFFKRKLG
jgi:carboxymethylenebutenolidase